MVPSRALRASPPQIFRDGHRLAFLRLWGTSCAATRGRPHPACDTAGGAPHTPDWYFSLL